MVATATPCVNRLFGCKRQRHLPAEFQFRWGGRSPSNIAELNLVNTRKLWQVGSLNVPYQATVIVLDVFNSGQFIGRVYPDKGRFDSNCSSCAEIGGFGCFLRGAQCPENQITLTSPDDHQASGKNNQPKIKPPDGVIWWRRRMASFVFLYGSIYAVRNGFRKLLLQQRIRGWCWLGFGL